MSSTMAVNGVRHRQIPSAGFFQRLALKTYKGLLAFVCCAAFNATPALANSSLQTHGGSASAVVQISVIIPAVLRLLENSHPLSLLVPQDSLGSRVSATQRLTLISTLRAGFCMDLQLNQAQVSAWQVSVSGAAGAWMQRSESGYRLCTRRPGRYDLSLQHDFDVRQVSAASTQTTQAMDWPVHVSLNSP
ncbi:MAG: hypothetical protein JWP47_2135 [Polaromonas sp.]|jgi:hypothetical protein|nr:hypothetical protein [Polaromonas sp.]